MSYSLLALALILNLLVFVLVKCVRIPWLQWRFNFRLSKRITDFRNVFYTYCVANSVFAVVFSIALMVNAQIKRTYIFLTAMGIPSGDGSLLSNWPVRSQSHYHAYHFPSTCFTIFVYFATFQLQTVIYIYVMCLVCATFVYRYLIVVRYSLISFQVQINSFQLERKRN